MYVIPEYKVCFLATPRTGSKAIAKALVEQRGAVLVGSHHTTPVDHPDFDIQDWTVMSAVRNHWDTMVSWWFKIERRGKMTPLKEFIPRFCHSNSNHVTPGSLFGINEPFTTHTIRYEWLASDLDFALVAAGMAPVNLPELPDPKREKRPYQMFYKREAKDWVAVFFKEEIAKYGYKF